MAGPRPNFSNDIASVPLPYAVTWPAAVIVTSDSTISIELYHAPGIGVPTGAPDQVASDAAGEWGWENLYLSTGEPASGVVKQVQPFLAFDIDFPAGTVVAGVTITNPEFDATLRGLQGQWVAPILHVVT